MIADRLPGGAERLLIRASPLILFTAGAGFAGATGESRLGPDVIFCSAAAAAENLPTRSGATAAHGRIAIAEVPSPMLGISAAASDAR